MSKLYPPALNPQVATDLPTARLYLTPEEVHLLIAACAKRGRNRLRNKVLVTMLYRHGLRVTEACEMRWSDINLRAGSLFIRRKKKGKDATHSLARDELTALRALQAESDGGAFVFLSEQGNPLSPDMVARVVKQGGEAAGFDIPLHPHMLRHAAGYMLTNDGVDMRLIQDFLGHRTASMTMHYCALSPQRLAAVRVR